MDRLAYLNLLFLEDNEEFASNTAEFLDIYFKNVYCCKDTKEALLKFNENRIDVIISDVKVKDKNGLDFIKDIREFDKECIIVVLSAFKDEEYLLKAIGLNLISYEIKPLRYNDFIKLLQKISSAASKDKKVAIHDNLEYDFNKKILFYKNKEVKLTKKEMLFIELLIKEQDKYVSYERVQRDVWENRVMSDAAVKNMVFRLRKKTGVDFISTTQGVGYTLSKTISF